MTRLERCRKLRDEAIWLWYDLIAVKRAITGTTTTKFVEFGREGAAAVLLKKPEFCDEISFIGVKEVEIVTFCSAMRKTSGNVGFFLVFEILSVRKNAKWRVEEIPGAVTMSTTIVAKGVTTRDTAGTKRSPRKVLNMSRLGKTCL